MTATETHTLSYLPYADDSQPMTRWDQLEGIERLRELTDWANWQNENSWLPARGKPPTLDQIAALRRLTIRWDVETPGDLRDHEDHRARAEYAEWLAGRDA
jgi:hypothetical protein